MFMTVAIMLFLYTILMGALVAVVSKEEWKKKYYVVIKSICSLGFLMVFLAAGYQSGAFRQFWLMLPAFICCLVGDVFMALYNRRRKKTYFLMGTFCFLMGHICFVRWMCRMQPVKFWDFIFPIVMVLVAWILTGMRKIHTGRLRPFIIVYAFFVAMLFAKGVGIVVATRSLAGYLAAAGSALFLISDVSILFLYFRKHRGPGVHIFNLLTYYYGMFLLAVNMLFLGS